MALNGFQWPAVRATLRLASRDAWRNKGRSALIALMVALPVLAASTVSVLYRSDENDPQDMVRLTIGTQGQASITIGDGHPIEQPTDGLTFGDLPGGPAAQPKSLTPAQFLVKAQALISPRDRLVADSRLNSGRTLRFKDRSLNAAVRELDYATAGLAGLVEPISGRAPAQAGEVVVTKNLARKEGIKVGDPLSYTPPLNGTTKTLTVVGVVGGIALVGDSSVIGPTGSLIPASLLAESAMRGLTSRTLLVSGPDPVTWDQVLDLNQLGAAVVSRAVIDHPPPADRVPYARDRHNRNGGPVDASAVGIGVVVIGLVLLQIALLAGPAIAVGARRNQRTLALLASSGAERKHLRAVVLASSAVIGLVSCLTASLLGAGLGAIIVQLLRQYADRQLVRIDIRPLDLLGLTLVGGLTAVAAALIPARQAAKLDVVAALTGRRGQQPPRLRVPVAGLVLAAAGAVLAYLGSEWIKPLIVVSGLALTEIGLVAASGAIVALAARLAVRLPFTPRFALRDAARQRGRTAPAVAAVLAAIAGGTVALVYIAAQAQHDRQAYTPTSALGVVRVEAGNPEKPADFASLQTALRRTLPVRQVATYYGVANQSDDTGWVYLTVQPPLANRCPGTNGTGQTGQPVSRSNAADPRCAATPSGPDVIAQWTDLFDDGSALAVLTGHNDPADAAALQAGQVLVFDPLLLRPDGTVRVHVRWEAPGVPLPAGAPRPKSHTVTMPARLSTSTPRLTRPAFPRSAAGVLGVKLAPLGLFASTTRMPTSTEEDAAKAATSDAFASYLSIERGYHDDYSITLLALVVAAGLVTLGGTFTAVGLAAAEGRADVATLAAVGASPAVRRRLAAGQAGVIAGLGAVLGVASGVLAGWILVRMQQDDLQTINDGPSAAGDRWQLVIPWTYLLIIAVGIPLLVMLVGYLTTRSRLPLLRRLAQ